MTAATTGSDLEYAIGAEGLLSVRLRGGDARIRAVDGATVRIRDVHDHDLTEMFAIEFGDGSASLRADRGTDLLGRRGRGATPDLDIELPRNATVVIETASADIDVDGLLGDQRYRTASGDIALRGVSGRVAIESVSGDVDVVATGQADVTLRTVSGDVELRAGTIRSLQATTTSGDLKIAGRLAGPGPFSVVTVSGDALLAPAGDVRIEMATLSGDLQSEIGGRIEGGPGRRTMSIGAGGPQVEFRSMSGDLTVVRPRPVVEAAAAASASGADLPPQDPGSAPNAGDGPPAATAMNGTIAVAYEEARLRILRSLERGEIDVAEAGRRLEALDSGPGEPLPPSDEPSDA
jgi:DUF4097 and DUF4098 domain-containing protein YvlB